MRPSGFLLMGLVKVLIGAYPRWIGCTAADRQRIYFANHSSHVDTLALWAALPSRLRERTHPVAARDYWGHGWRQYVASKTLRAVLIDRTQAGGVKADPLLPLAAILRAGESLILFPEGTRGHDPLPARFKSGLYHLARRFPEVELVPAYLENLHRSMPKGVLLPVPMTCTVRFGAPLTLMPGESKEAFLTRTRQAVVELSGLTEEAP